MLNKERLQLVVVECFVAELDVLVTNVGEHGRLRVQVVVLSRLGHDATLNVAEKTIGVDMNMT